MKNKTFWYFIGALTLFRLFYIYFLPLIPQEAYYWYYAQKPALSYFDHPPMAAYSIWLGTKLFGNTVFGVKFMAVIWALLTNILLYFTILEAVGRQKTQTAFVGVVLYNLTVFAHIYALLIAPDVPLMFFWLLVVYWIARALRSGQGHYWLAAGLSLGLALLSKYTAVAILPGIMLFVLLSKKHRRVLLTPGPYIGVAVAALIFYQVVYWNQQHQWASFAFQFSQRANEAKPFQITYFLQLLGSQIFLLTPLGMILLLTAGYKLIRSKRYGDWAGYYYLSGIAITAGFVFISLRSLVKMNWLLPGYLGMLVAVVILLEWDTLKNTRWFKSAASFSILLILATYTVQVIPNLPLGEGNTWSGWREASGEIYRYQQDNGGRKKMFVFGNSYKSASLLKFYMPDHQDTYAQNIYDRPALEFDIWGIPDSLRGKDAIFVHSDRKEYPSDLKYVKNYFDSIELIKARKFTFYNDAQTRTIYYYRAINYHGKNE